MTTSLNFQKTIYFTVATAGHVDHGKTSLLRALTGIDPDRLKEEKERQMTTDLGFAHLKLSEEGKEIVLGFIDVPGHGKFLKNMLAGVGGIDLALLVVAADEGPMPQTEQHAKILSLLGITQIVGALTKIDVAGKEQKENAVRRFKEMCQLYELNILELVEVSPVTGQGIDNLKTALAKALIRATRRAGRMTFQRTTGDSTENAFLPIDRVFSKSGFGVVITGTLVKGVLSVNDQVSIEPGALKARVRGLEAFGQTLSSAQPGQRLAVNLSLKENKPLRRGQAIIQSELSQTRTLMVTLEAKGADQLASLKPQAIRFYHGTAECLGDLRFVQKSADGTVHIGQIALAEPIIAEPQERFIMRFGDHGLVGGSILMTARPRWLLRQKLAAVLEPLAHRDYVRALTEIIEICPQKAITLTSLSMLLASDSEFLRLLKEGKNKDQFSCIGDFVVTLRSKQKLVERILEETERMGKKELEKSDSSAVSLQSLKSKAMPTLDRNFFQAVVKELTDDGRLIRVGEKISLPQRETSTASADAKSNAMSAGSTALLTILAAQPCIEIKELAKLSKLDEKKTISILNALSKEGKAHIVNYEYASDAAHLALAHQSLNRVWLAKKEISPSDFKEDLGVSRKYAMALLAYFDDHSVTRRSANSRVLLKQPK